MGSRSIDSDGERGAIHGDDASGRVDVEAHVEAPVEALGRPAERRDKGAVHLVVVPWRFRGTFWRANVLATRSSCARMVPVSLAGATGPRRPAWLFLVFIKYKASTLNIVPIYSVVTLCDDVRDLNANPCRAGRFLQCRRQNACLLVSYRTLAFRAAGFVFV